MEWNDNDRDRTVRVHISAENMGRLLGVPAGAHVVAMRSDIDPVGVAVLVWSPDFPLKEHPECESPYIQGKIVSVEHEVGEVPPIPKPEWDWPSREAQMVEDMVALAEAGITGTDAATAYASWCEGNRNSDTERVWVVLGEPIGRA